LKEDKQRENKVYDFENWFPSVGERSQWTCVVRFQRLRNLQRLPGDQSNSLTRLRASILCTKEGKKKWKRSYKGCSERKRSNLTKFQLWEENEKSKER
jgi:hypothetical protein